MPNLSFPRVETFPTSPSQAGEGFLKAFQELRKVVGWIDGLGNPGCAPLYTVVAGCRLCLFPKLNRGGDMLIVLLLFKSDVGL